MQVVPVVPLGRTVSKNAHVRMAGSAHRPGVCVLADGQGLTARIERVSARFSTYIKNVMNECTNIVWKQKFLAYKEVLTHVLHQWIEVCKYGRLTMSNYKGHWDGRQGSAVHSQQRAYVHLVPLLLSITQLSQRLVNLSNIHKTYQNDKIGFFT